MRPRTASSCSWHFMWVFLLAFSRLLYAASLLLFSSGGCLINLQGSAGAAVSQTLHLLSVSKVLLAHHLNAQPYFLPPDSKYKGRDLREMEGPWNALCFRPPRQKLSIALFVKKWAVAGVPGGLERHALTLHKALAERGHTVHVYTVSVEGNTQSELHVHEGLTVHFINSTPHGGFNYAKVWESFVAHNATKPAHNARSPLTWFTQRA